MIDSPDDPTRQAPDARTPADEALPEVTLIRAVATTMAESVVPSGSLPPLLAFLVDGDLRRTTRRQIVDRLGGPDVRPYEMNLLVSFAPALVLFAPLEPLRRRAWALLKAVFDIQEGEFLRHVPVEVSGLLRARLDEILEDSVIDPAEDLEQVALQEAFDLSYDQYLAVTRGSWELAADRLRESLPHERDPQRHAVLAEHMRLLAPLVRLATLHERRLGALY